MNTRTRGNGRGNAQPNPIVFCDFDGTITQVDVTDQILSQLAHPSWREVEQEWVRGSIGSRECLERQMALVSTTRAEFNLLVDAIPIDPHFRSFQAFLARQRVPFYVVSDGFDYIIRRVLKRAGVNGLLRNGARLFSSGLRFDGRRLELSFPYSVPPCEHGCATCKAAIMRRLGKGRRPVIFIGDGFSDRFAVEEADVVFAKGQLLTYCRQKDIACRPFDTFADVQGAMEKILGIRNSRRSRRIPAAVG
ncbi:MAG TPA: MtnX-like HAD-IB family phosphatase [Terriglobia bacterium]|nr:MtnX-like HAD-IB family phosphatase [Terriglobia bacterium]